MENQNESFDTQSQDVEKTTENNQSTSSVITINGRQYTENDIIALQKKEEHWKKKFNKIKEETTDETISNIDTTHVESNKPLTNDKRVDILYFKQMHPELEIADIEEIIDISEAKRVSLDDAFKMPLIQNNLKYKQINQQNINATPNTDRAAKSLPTTKLEEISKITDPEAHKRAVLGL
jgi:tellurite resistance protein